MMLGRTFVDRAAKPSSVRNLSLAAVFAWLGIAPRLAHANSIASSLSNSTQTVLFSPSNWVASSFTTGYQSWQLTNLTLSLLQGGTSPSMADVRLFSDNA